MRRLLSALWLLRRAHAVAYALDVGYERAWATAPRGLASVTMDFHPASEGPSWGPNASALEIDLGGPVRAFAGALAPAVLRLGGSEAGSEMIYSGFPGGPACPMDYYYCISPERWDALRSFANETGLRLMLDLNIMGPNGTDFYGAGLKQVAALLNYTAASGPAVWAWEIGNENQDDLDAPEAAKRVRAVRAALDAAYDGLQRPLLVGPSPHVFTDWIEDFLDAAGDAIDIFSYHLYAGYGLAPEIAQQVASTDFLDDSRSVMAAATEAARRADPAFPALVSETAAAWHSGAPNVTDAFESGYWYLDHLMAAAAGGYAATCRQTLVGGDYALVDNSDWRANPDVYVARLWREVMEGRGETVTYLYTGRRPVIATDELRALRAQGACGANGTFVVAVANLAADAVNVTLDFGDPALQARREEWVLTAASDDSRTAKLNGKQLDGSADAPLPPKSVDAAGTVFEAPAQSLAFVRYPKLVPPACVPQDDAAAEAGDDDYHRAPVEGRPPVTADAGSCGATTPTAALNCSFNGRCRDGACVCKAGWKGQFCHQFDLLPATNTSGLNLLRKEPFLSTWGGSVTYDRGLYHMYYSEISRHCGIHRWLTNSVVGHATSRGAADGWAFTRQSDTVRGLFSHEPVVARAPTGELVLYLTSFAGDAGAGPVCNCTDGTSASGEAGCATEVGPGDNVTLFSSFADATEPAGPWANWRSLAAVQATPSIDMNLAPIIFANGSAAPRGNAPRRAPRTVTQACSRGRAGTSGPATTGGTRGRAATRGRPRTLKPGLPGREKILARGSTRTASFTWCRTTATEARTTARPTRRATAGATISPRAAPRGRGAWRRACPPRTWAAARMTAPWRSTTAGATRSTAASGRTSSWVPTVVQ
mmetsp:Transcript_14396/g.42992  ORF Transcript_14396/g.42992 Transcript_14396/m.42992 type:complete len:881 (-) Transcript_14396:185-2827(-)